MWIFEKGGKKGGNETMEKFSSWCITLKTKKARLLERIKNDKDRDTSWDDQGWQC